MQPEESTQRRRASMGGGVSGDSRRHIIADGLRYAIVVCGSSRRNSTTAVPATVRVSRCAAYVFNLARLEQQRVGSASSRIRKTEQREVSSNVIYIDGYFCQRASGRYSPGKDL